MNPLERPVWSSLSTAHVHLSVGDGLARRYAPRVNRFASACDDSDGALGALAALVRPSEQVYILQVPEIALPPGLAVARSGR